MFGHVDVLYWKMAAICAVMALFFFYITTESLIRGKLKLPAWVFSSFTLVLGIFFFKVFIDSLGEFNNGRHDTLDDMIKHLRVLARFLRLS